MIKIIDYKAGNAPSVLSAVNQLGFNAQLVSTAEDLKGATHIILPGVGSAGATMKSLKELNIINALEKAVLKDKVKFLGVCVGLQILFTHSEEENADCLNWLSGKVYKFDTKDVKVPQMGWNKVCFVKDTDFLKKGGEDFFYYVNSYYVKPDDESIIWGKTNYGEDFTAAINKDNIYGTQFHIEKSGNAGLELLELFLRQPAKVGR